MAPLLRRQGAQNFEANKQRKVPRKMLPASEWPVLRDRAGGGGGRRTRGARGKMTHCSENSLFQTSGQAAGCRGPGAGAPSERRHAKYLRGQGPSMAEGAPVTHAECPPLPGTGRSF